MSVLTRKTNDVSRWVDGTLPFLKGICGRRVPVLLTRAQVEAERLEDAAAAVAKQLLTEETSLSAAFAPSADHLQDGEVSDRRVADDRQPSSALPVPPISSNAAPVQPETELPDVGEEFLAESLHEPPVTPRSHQLTPRSTCGTASTGGGGNPAGSAVAGNHLNARNLHRHVNILMQKTMLRSPPTSVSAAAVMLMRGYGSPVGDGQLAKLETAAEAAAPG
jgi:hypothetical protein